jgi:CheY-like chemotaxis protein
MSKTIDMSSPSNVRGPGEPAAILVADPDVAFARRTAALLRHQGYRTEACAGGSRRTLLAAVAPR